MNILMVHPHDIFSKEEPWTIRIKSLALEMLKKGHSVKLVYFPLDSKGAGKRSLWEGIEVFSLSRKLGVANFLKNVVFMVKQAGWGDVVHFQKCFYYAALPAIIGGLVRNRHLHYDWDDWEIKIYFCAERQNHLMGMYLWLMERCMPLLADTVSVSSERLKKECINYGLPEERIYEGHVGGDPERFNPQKDGTRIKERYSKEAPLVLYVGQLHGGQYVELFIRAASELDKKGVKANFMIMGGGYTLPELEKFSKSLGLDGKVIFTGYVAHDEVPLYMSAADICVACFEKNDITECKSPLKIVEYLASGRPIVASDVGEVSNMLDNGRAGILVKAGDSVSLADGIERLLRDDKLMKQLSVRARERAENKYNWTDTAESLLKAYGSRN